MFKSILAWTLRLIFRVEVSGIDNYYQAGDKTVIVANHLSFLDGILLAAFLSEKVLFAINSNIAKRWYFKPFFSLIRVFVMDPTSPMSIKSMIATINQNQKCVIFPEGRITTTGSLMKVYEGAGFIIDKTHATILPIRIDGAQYSLFSRLKGKVRRRWFPKITLTFLPPEQLNLPQDLKGRLRRQKSGEKLYDLLVDMIFASSDYHKTLTQALLAQSQLLGREHLIAEDIARQPLSYGKLIQGAIALGQQINRHTQANEYVGLLLPNANVNLLSFFALQYFARIPAMLNFSAGSRSLLSACATGQIKTVLTSRQFIKKGKLESLIDALQNAQIKVVYLEDLKQQITGSAKLAAFMLGRLASLYYQFIHRTRNLTAESAAVLLFTSGSEGIPKGVVLSHQNILANCKQLAACVDFSPSDRVFNVLPMFHSFGLTGGTLLPVLAGIKVFFYPSPLHYCIIPELIYDTNATILFGTETFLSGYARYAHNYDFYSLRYIFAGAEKLKDSTRLFWSEKYGVRIFEGYGVTETAPVIAINTPMYHKSGTVGRLLPGMRAELQTVEGVSGKRLYVTGPNVMKGYLLHDSNGQIIPPQNQQHDTGDIVEIDDDGFIHILGRAKRFAKIAGEMVSLAAIESVLTEHFPQTELGVIAVADERKGEALVLFSNSQEIDNNELRHCFRNAGLSELALPKTQHYLEKLPLLGTGKLDYVKLAELAKTL